MQNVSEVIDAIAAKDVTVTLIGESGVGKEVLARRLHDLSGRTGPFIAINCAAIPDALFESELFGHERGAFTGASVRARGKVEAAEGGTLFLDEIGELPLHMQAKLLRFLENRRFMRVGGAEKIAANVRLVFATLRPLEEEVLAQRFRNDLYYRIQGITIGIPPLRERRADIGPLLDRFLVELSQKHGVRRPRLTRDARALLLGHDWPGNVRELRNVVESLCLLHAGRPIGAAELPLIRKTPATDVIVVQLDQPLGEIVDRVVSAAVVLEGGNPRRAARRLGISVRTVQRHLKGRAT